MSVTSITTLVQSGPGSHGNIKLVSLVYFFKMTYQPFMGYLIPKFDTNNLHKVICFQTLLSNTQKFQKDLL